MDCSYILLKKRNFHFFLQLARKVPFGRDRFSLA